MKCQFDDSISPNDYLQYEADSSSLECLHKGDVGNIVRDAYDTREISKKPNLYKGAFQLGKQVEKDETTVHPSKTAVGATFLAAFLAHVDTEQSRTTDLRLELSTKWLKPDRIDVLSTVPLARTISNYFAPNKAVVQEADLSQPTAFADINKRFSSRDADIVQLDPTAHPPVKNIRKAHIEIQKGKRLTAVAREAEYLSFLADLTCGLDADIVQLDPTAHPPVKNIRKAHIEIQKGKRLAPEPIDFDDII